MLVPPKVKSLPHFVPSTVLVALQKQCSVLFQEVSKTRRTAATLVVDRRRRGGGLRPWRPAVRLYTLEEAFGEGSREPPPLTLLAWFGDGARTERALRGVQHDDYLFVLNTRVLTS